MNNLELLTVVTLSSSLFQGSVTLDAKLLFLMSFLCTATVLETYFYINLRLPAPPLASSIFHKVVLSNLVVVVHYPVDP